jgi:hypothetical protein
VLVHDGNRDWRRESMNPETDYRWQRTFQETISESDPIQIETKAQPAEVAII